MNTDPGAETQPPGWGLVVGWLLVAFLVGCGGLSVVGLMGYQSESGGVLASYISAFPVGFALSGFAAALAVQLLHRKPGPVRMAVPLGCGCLGGLGLMLAAVIFFAAIFPAL